MSTQELFPKHLLVSLSSDKRIYTTSRRVAEYFGKEHFHVLRDIEQLITNIKEESMHSEGESNFGFSDYTNRFAQLNFELRDYIDSTGRFLPEYHLTHDGFALLAMGFTGREALRWKVTFLEAFRDLERQVRELTEQKAQALDALHPHWPIVRDGTIQGLNRKEICGLTGHQNPSSITYARRRLRKLGLLN